MAIQTPKQRLANERFNKNIEKNRKYGKKKVAKSTDNKFPISKYWIAAIFFLLVGGGVLELLSFLF